ncbi:MAG: DUF1015 domain-containing protein [Halanaerobiales bacterium]
MAEVYPFCGYRYNPKKINNINQVVTPPYDKINEREQESYYTASPYNIVRLILGKGEKPFNNRYEEAADNLNKWMKKNIVVKEDKKVFYVYVQEYEIENKKYKRKGFIGLGKIEGEEGVKAHEETMEGPKADRLNLIRATEANFGHIFMLYSDKEKKVNNILNQIVEKDEPLLEVKDKDQNKHQLWKIEDAEAIDLIKEHMKNKKLYIADGHHRYQTALNFKNECEKKGYTGDFDKRMMTFVNIEDPGLTILPTHRLVYGLPKFNIDKFLKEIKSEFSVSQFIEKEDMYDKMEKNVDENIFGFCSKYDDKYYTLTLKEDKLMDSLIPDHSRKWRKLDVAVLHKAILERYMGIDEKALEEKRNIDYIRYRDQAIKQLKNDDKYQTAFILNPTSVQEVKEVADIGERMPQKSTDFYPKLLTGLTLFKLSIDKK